MTIIWQGWPWLAACMGLLTLLGTFYLTNRLPEFKTHRKRHVGLCVVRLLGVLVMMIPVADPVWEQVRQRSIPIRVAVMIDNSASMMLTDQQASPSEKLDELLALGWISPQARPYRAGLAAQGLADLVIDSTIPAAIQLQKLAEVQRLAAGTQWGNRIALLSEGNALRDSRDRDEIIAGLQHEQAQADMALIQSTTGPIAEALERWHELNRYERAQRLIDKTLLPHVGWNSVIERVNVTTGSQGGLTDPARGLTNLLQGWSNDQSGLVLYVTDGRQTTGLDPHSVVRVLSARGIRVVPIVIGSATPARDAALGKVRLLGKASIGMPVRFEVATRLQGMRGSATIALSRDDKIIDHVRVVNNGSWNWQLLQDYRPLPGPMVYHVRIEPDELSKQSWIDDVSHNNHLAIPVRVLSQPIKIDILSATPRREWQHAAASMRRVGRVQLTWGSATSNVVGMSERDPFSILRHSKIILCSARDIANEPSQKWNQWVYQGGRLIVIDDERQGDMPHHELFPIRGKDGTRQASGNMIIEAVLSDRINNVFPQGQLEGIQQVSLRQQVWLQSGAHLWMSSDSGVPVIASWRRGAGKVMWIGSGDLWTMRSQGGGEFHSALWDAITEWASEGIMDTGVVDGMNFSYGIEETATHVIGMMQCATRPKVVISRTFQHFSGTASVAITQLDSHLWTLEIPRPPADVIEEIQISVSDNNSWYSIPIAGPQKIYQEYEHVATDPLAAQRVASVGETIIFPKQLAKFWSMQNDFLLPRSVSVRIRERAWNGWILALCIAVIFAFEVTLRRRWGMP